MIWKLLLSKLLFAGTMFLAAGADAMAGIADGGGEGGFDGGADLGADTGSISEGANDSPADGDAGADGSATEGTDLPARTAAPVEEKEATEFKGLVSQRMQAFKKEAPELAEVFTKHPGLQDKFEGIMRRDSAYRECFGTVAEARQMRELFPAGIKDVEVLQSDARELQELDSLFDSRGQDGSYPGHKDVIANMFQRDAQAAVNFCRTFPKEWARFDPDSYNDVNGKMVGAVLAGMQVSDQPLLDYIAGLHESAKAEKQEGMAGSLARIWNKLNTYIGAKEGAKPSAEQEAITRDRQALDRDRQSRTTADFNRFREDYNTQSLSLTRGIIEKVPAVAALAKVRGLAPGKREEVLKAIHVEIGSHLKKSVSFMRQLTPLYKAGKLQEALQLQKSAWSNPAVLNMIVRRVLARETPTLVTQNREALQRRAGTPQARVPVKTSEQSPQQAPTKPYQVGKTWFHANGSQMTNEDILQGKHRA